LATNGVSHAIEAKRELQDVLTCVKHKTKISEHRALRAFTASFCCLA